MLIVCDNCGAEYEVDVDEDVGAVPGRGLRFRCSACGHTFSVSDDSAVQASEIRSDADQSLGEGAAGEPPMLLKQEGKVYQVEGVATLQRWIVERRVLREDMISIGGLKWEPVGSRRDLQVFFHLVEHAERSTISGGGMPPPLAGEPDAHAVEGQAPWEAPAVGAADGPHEDDDSFAAPEADHDELEDDEGTDAGLPVADLLAGGSAYDEALLSAPDPGQVRAAVPNLAEPVVADHASDDTEEEPAQPIASAPGPEEGLPVSTASSVIEPAEPALSQDMFFPDETEELPRTERISPRWVEPEPPRSGVPAWVYAAVAVVVLLGLGWLMLRGGQQVGSTPRATTQASTPAPEPALAPTVEVAAPQPPAAEQPPPQAEAVAGAAAAESAAAESAPAEPAPPEPAAAAAAPEPAAAPVERVAPVAASPSSQPASSSRATTSTSSQSSTTTARTQPAAAASTRTAPARATSPKALIDAGWSAIERGSFSDARQAFADALELQPGSSDARFGLGYAYEKLGNQPAAERYYCSVASSGSGDARIEAQGRLRALEVTCQ